MISPVCKSSAAMIDKVPWRTQSWSRPMPACLPGTGGTSAPVGTGNAKCALNLRGSLAVSAGQQNLRAFDFTLRRSVRTREFTQRGSVFLTEHQRCPPRLSCRANLRKDVLKQRDCRAEYLRKAFSETKYQGRWGGLRPGLSRAGERAVDLRVHL